MTREGVSHKNVKPSKSRAFYRHGLILLQRYDAGKWEYHTGRTDADIVRGDDCYAIEKNGLDDILPWPERKWHVGKRGKISVEHQSWARLWTQFGWLTDNVAHRRVDAGPFLCSGGCGSARGVGGVANSLGGTRGFALGVL